MPARTTAPVSGPYKFKAIVSLDPAGVGDSGIAVRLTAPLPVKPQRGKLRCPEYTYQGNVFNDVMYDELGVFFAKNVGRNGPVLFCVEDCVYQGLHIARHIGTAIGAVRSFLVGCGWSDSATAPTMVAPVTWRKAAFGPVKPGGRKAQKEAAVERCRLLYGFSENMQDDLAESVLLNDYVTVFTPELWQ